MSEQTASPIPSPTITIPRINVDQPASQILIDVAIRLGEVAAVMSRELTWLRPKVERSRAEEASDVAAGFVDPDVYDGTETTLILDNSQLDLHLQNIEAAALIAADLAAAIKAAGTAETK